MATFNMDQLLCIDQNKYLYLSGGERREMSVGGIRFVCQGQRVCVLLQ